MGVPVVITPTAIADLGEIVRFIASDSPERAKRFGYALIDQALSLSPFPSIQIRPPEDQLGNGHLFADLHPVWNSQSGKSPSRRGKPVEFGLHCGRNQHLVEKHAQQIRLFHQDEIDEDGNDRRRRSLSEQPIQRGEIVVQIIH